MNYLISVCIPTYNRAELLKAALLSIVEELPSQKVQICVSNNNSNSSYLAVEEWIRDLNSPAIVYVRQETSLSIDENMHACVKLCTGKFIYYLGDDDYFLAGGIKILREILENNSVDVLIPKSINVGDDGKLISITDLRLKNSTFSLGHGFQVLSEKQTFGALLVRRNLVKDETFILLYGTSHAYGGYWLDLEKEWLFSQSKVHFFTTDIPVVALRQGAKTYSNYMADIFYRQIPRWFARIHESSTSEELRSAVKKVGDGYIARTSTFKHCLYYVVIGVPPLGIIEASREFFGVGMRCKIWFLSKIPRPVILYFYSNLKKIFNKISKINSGKG